MRLILSGLAGSGYRLHFWLPLTVGGFVYALYRPMDLVGFRLLEFVGLLDAVVAARELVISGVHLPDFVIFSVPTGLWVYALAFSVARIVDSNRLNRSSRFIALGAVCVLVTALEFFQLMFLPGTFDWDDVFCIVTGACLATPHFKLVEG